MELYKVGMQKCSLTTSANNREVSVIPDLLAGSPPAGMPHVEGNSHHTSVTELNAGEFRTKPIQRRQCATVTVATLVIIALHK